MLSKFIAPLIVFACAATPVAAQEKPSFDIETMLQMAWETQWTEYGMPMYVTKWNKPIKVRYIGDRVSELKEAAQEAFRRYIEVTGLVANEVSADDATANFTVELKREDKLATESISCYTSSKFDLTGAYTETRLVIIYRNARTCLWHEMGHAFGMLGHPLAKSTMTYFGAPNKLTDLDVFYLKNLYSAAIVSGDTPFKVLEVMRNQYSETISSPEEKQKALAASGKFMLDTKIEMDNFAMSNSEAPSVLYRSGRANPATIETARSAMAVLLARSYLPKNPKPDEVAYALRYLETAAERGWLDAMWYLSIAYMGQKIPATEASIQANPLRFHAWASCLAVAGGTDAQTWIKSFESQLTPAQSAVFHAQTKKFFDEGKCKIPPKS